MLIAHYVNTYGPYGVCNLYVLYLCIYIYCSKLFQTPAAPRGECGLLGEVPLRQGCRSTGNPRFNGKIIDQNGGDVFYIYIIYMYIYIYTHVRISLWFFMDFPCLMTRDDNGWHMMVEKKSTLILDRSKCPAFGEKLWRWSCLLHQWWFLPFRHQPYQQPPIQHRFCRWSK